MPAKRDPLESFLEKFESLENGCWLWTAGRQKDGYGIFGSLIRGRQPYLAHRCSWMLFRGDIPAGMYVLHRCDNPPCVNPDHLFLGDQAANMADMKAKGRSPYNKGNHHPRAKLTEKQVVAIRQDARSCRDLAEIYGVIPNTISKIKRGELWGHVTIREVRP